MMPICQMLLLTFGCFLWTAAVTRAGRHSGVRSLNELLIESQSVRDLPPFVAHLPPRPLTDLARLDPVMIAPKKKQTREKKLRRILGRDYDEQWVSLVEPKVKVLEERSNQSDRDLASELASLNVSVMLGDNKGVATLTPQVGKVIEKWLLQRSACSVTFIWDDLGSLFWPRWVKRGVCGTGKRDLDRKYGPGFVLRQDPGAAGRTEGSSGPEVSCSWPAGMHCVPSESHTVRVLRWHCYPRGRSTRNRGDRRDRRQHRQRAPAGVKGKPRGGDIRQKAPVGGDGDDDGDDAKPGEGSGRSHRRTRMKCIWIKVPYPVTSECFCSC